jgi:2-dehydropantoate 2-reductase
VTQQRLLVFGTGATAVFFAARLARGGKVSVAMAGTWPEALAAIARDGLQIEEPGGAWRVAVEVLDREWPLPRAELILVLVKSHQTRDAARAAARALTEDGLVLSLQNGLGNREVLEDAVGPGRVALGAVYGGFLLEGPGRVRAVPGKVVLGPGAEAARAPLEAAGLPVETSASLEPLLWRKLAANCAINPLSALLGVPNGALLQDAATCERLLAAAREVGAVAAARGIDLGEDAGALAIEVARATATNRSSMLQDLERGALTEIDALCGAVVAEARRLGVPAPVNEGLWREVKARERVEART